MAAAQTKGREEDKHTGMQETTKKRKERKKTVRAALARWQGRVSAVSHTRISAVSHTRPNHSCPVSLQRPVCRGQKYRTHAGQRRHNTTASPRLRRGAGRCCCRGIRCTAAMQFYPFLAPRLCELQHSIGKFHGKNRGGKN